MIENKYKKLIISILLDLIGNITYIMPGFAETIDVVWAPTSAFLMTKLYQGKSGKVGAVISFFEEAFPFTDIIPSFTLMWIYTYIISAKSEKTLIEK